MNIHRIVGARQVALAAGLTLAAGLGVTAPAHAQSDAQIDSPSASVTGGTLTITGTDGNDTIAIAPSTADPTTLLVDLGNGSLPQSFDRSTFTAISVFLQRGDDQFQVVPVGPLADEALRVLGGSGDDTIVGGDGSDLLNGGAGADTVRGGDDSDVIFGEGGADLVDGGRGNDTEFLGGGHDDALWNPGDGSDQVTGDEGTDTLFFNGSNAAETMSLSAVGGDAVLLRDVGAVRMDLDGVEGLALTARGGADRVTVGNLDGTALDRADIDLSSLGSGDLADDTVTVEGSNDADHVKVGAAAGAVDVTGLRTETRITGSESTDQLAVHTLAGDDTVDVSDAARALIGIAVDLGTGQR